MAGGRHLPSQSFEDQVAIMQAMGRLGSGETFWVGNSTTLSKAKQFGGSNNNSGESQFSPLSTVAAAMAKCKTGRNDNVILLPGHAESIIAANGFSVQKAGITFLGLGRGTNRPTFTFTTATTADLEVDAAQTAIGNCRFLASIDELAGAIDVNAADFSFIGNEVRLTDATNGASVQTINFIVSDANADGMTIKDNFVWGLGVAAAAGGTHFLYDVGANDVTIHGNYMNAAFTSGEGAIFQDTAAGRNWDVQLNRINNTLTGCTVGMSLHASTTGIKHANIWGILGGATPVIAAGMQWGIDWEQGSVGAVASLV